MPDLFCTAQRAAAGLPAQPAHAHAVGPYRLLAAGPAEIAADLGQTGVPTGLIGYEYRPVAETAVLDGFGECGVVVFGSCGKRVNLMAVQGLLSDGW
ncbi:hypothetical protein [Streptomyces sp. H39-S7]|uniref:hypothetical protein n=1 Tax=Streptomyces sp. H39-S7 TaxID=3004357 RepID=UPI0022B02535|nr:hypothetical protein [Streptomyces sp. H39-S7]MCZ4124759.1 hypothetical protein [Streptomyces sp. H39-S7]